MRKRCPVEKVSKRSGRKAKPVGGVLNSKSPLGKPSLKDRGKALHNRDHQSGRSGRTRGNTARTVYADLQGVNNEPLQIRNGLGPVASGATDAYALAAMADQFGSILRKLIEAAGLSLAQFAEKVGVSASFVSNVVAGDRTVPPDQHAKWADVLGLAGPIRERFLDYAILSHVPEEFAPRFREILRRLEQAERDA